MEQDQTRQGDLDLWREAHECCQADATSSTERRDVFVAVSMGNTPMTLVENAVCVLGDLAKSPATGDIVVLITGLSFLFWPTWSIRPRQMLRSRGRHPCRL